MRKAIAAAIALGAATIVVYAPALPGELQLDDVQLLEDPVVLSLASWAHGDAWQAAIAGGRPLTTFTFALNHALSGFETWPFHAVNLVLHLATVALVFLLARTTLRRLGAEPAIPAALAVAAAFALHPLQTQAVAYISQRAEVLASTLSLGALALLLTSDTSRTSLRRWALGAARRGARGVRARARCEGVRGARSRCVAAAWRLLPDARRA